MDIDSNNLFPEINPNIDEIVEKENMIDKEEVVKDDDMDYSAPKSTHKDIFMKTKNIKLSVKEPTDTETENDVINVIADKPKKDRYAHLAEARKKGIETRRRKAEEKRKAKEAEKLKKKEEREARRRATMERNRENARQRYYKQKAEKKNVAKKIVEDTKLTPTQKATKNPEIRNNNNMDFNTFARYMMKYEQMKDAYNKQKEKKNVKTKPIEIKKKEPEKPSYHPPNYPLAHLAPQYRYKQFNGF